MQIDSAVDVTANDFLWLEAIVAFDTELTGALIGRHPCCSTVCTGYRIACIVEVDILLYGFICTCIKSRLVDPGLSHLLATVGCIIHKLSQ